MGKNEIASDGTANIVNAETTKKVNYAEMARKFAGQEISEKVLAEVGLVDLKKAAETLEQGGDVKAGLHIVGALQQLDQLLSEENVNG